MIQFPITGLVAATHSPFHADGSLHLAIVDFAAPIYHRLMRAFAAGDWATAREEQFRSVQLVATLAPRGFMGAAKATMKMLGVDVGPARLPNGNLNAEQQLALRTELETLGFFDWIHPT